MFEALTVEAGAFDVSPSAFKSHNGVVLAGGATITFRTPEPPWSYAAGAPVPVAARDGYGVLIGLRLRTEGEVSLALLDSTGNGVIDQTTVHPSREPRTAYLSTSQPADVSSVMIRTAGLRGPVEVHLFEIEGRVLTRPPRLDELFSPAPLAPSTGWAKVYGTTPSGELMPALRSAAFDRLTDPLDVPWIEGSRITLWPGEQISRAVAVSGTYEPNTLCALRRLVAPGSYVIDVGANAGLFTAALAAFAGCRGRIVAVEPSPRELSPSVPAGPR